MRRLTLLVGLLVVIVTGGSLLVAAEEASSAPASENAAFTIEALIEYFNNNGIVIEGKGGNYGSVGTPVYRANLALVINKRPIEVCQYDLHDISIAELFKDAVPSGQYPIFKMGDSYIEVPGVSNGNLVIAD